MDLVGLAFGVVDGLLGYGVGAMAAVELVVFPSKQGVGEESEVKLPGGITYLLYGAVFGAG